MNDNFLEFNLNVNKMNVTFLGLNEKSDVLILKFGNNYKIHFLIEYHPVTGIEWNEDARYVFKVKKMDYKYFSEETNLIKAKNEFFESLLAFIEYGIKDKKLIKWLTDWGYKYNESIGGYM